MEDCNQKNQWLRKGISLNSYLRVKDSPLWRSQIFNIFCVHIFRCRLDKQIKQIWQTQWFHIWLNWNKGKFSAFSFMYKVFQHPASWIKVFPPISNGLKTNNNHFFNIENLRTCKGATLRKDKKILYILVSAKIPSSVAFLLFSLSLVKSKTRVPSPRCFWYHCVATRIAESQEGHAKE